MLQLYQRAHQAPHRVQARARLQAGRARVCARRPSSVSGLRPLGMHADRHVDRGGHSGEMRVLSEAFGSAAPILTRL